MGQIGNINYVWFKNLMNLTNNFIRYFIECVKVKAFHRCIKFFRVLDPIYIQ